MEQMESGMDRNCKKYPYYSKIKKEVKHLPYRDRW